MGIVFQAHSKVVARRDPPPQDVDNHKISPSQIGHGEIRANKELKDRFNGLINKEKSAELLCNIYSSVRQWILGNILKNEEKILLKNAENTMDMACEQ